MGADGTRPPLVCARVGTPSHAPPSFDTPNLTLTLTLTPTRWARASIRSASRSRRRTTASTGTSIARWRRAPPPPLPPPPRRRRRRARDQAAAPAAEAAAAAAAVVATPRLAIAPPSRRPYRPASPRWRRRWCAARRRRRPHPFRTACAWPPAPRATCCPTQCPNTRPNTRPNARRVLFPPGGGGGGRPMPPIPPRWRPQPPSERRAAPLALRRCRAPRRRGRWPTGTRSSSCEYSVEETGAAVACEPPTRVRWREVQAVDAAPRGTTLFCRRLVGACSVRSHGRVKCAQWAESE
eukprot:scaffold2064_cov48-Phaeocystis_antarctica.AAC.3